MLEWIMHKDKELFKNLLESIFYIGWLFILIIYIKIKSFLNSNNSLQKYNWFIAVLKKYIFSSKFIFGINLFFFGVSNVCNKCKSSNCMCDDVTIRPTSEKKFFKAVEECSDNFSEISSEIEAEDLLTKNLDFQSNTDKLDGDLSKLIDRVKDKFIYYLNKESTKSKLEFTHDFQKNFFIEQNTDSLILDKITLKNLFKYINNKRDIFYSYQVKDFINSDPLLLNNSEEEDKLLDIKNSTIDNSTKELELKKKMNWFEIKKFLKKSASVSVKKELEEKKNSELEVYSEHSDNDVD